MYSCNKLFTHLLIQISKHSLTMWHWWASVLLMNEWLRHSYLSRWQERHCTAVMQRERCFDGGCPRCYTGTKRSSHERDLSLFSLPTLGGIYWTSLLGNNSQSLHSLSRSLGLFFFFSLLTRQLRKGHWNLFIKHLLCHEIMFERDAKENRFLDFKGLEEYR